MSDFRLFDLNPEQYKAATHGDGPVLILAGAGSGKTRVITSRIAWLLAQGTAAERILAVTFTNKAAREMQARIGRMIEKEVAKKLTICTFHSLSVRILRQHASLLGYKENFSIYDESDTIGLVKKIIARTAAKDEKLDHQLVRNLISKAKSLGHAPPENDETLAGAVYARYSRELKSLNAMDFDDLLVNAVRLITDHDEARSYWNSRYQYLLVDEFQDTNRLQLELVCQLSALEPNVCVVGDDDQSIYGWRGAEVANILEFERHFPNPAVIKLEQNYRSTDIILGAANRLIRNNPRRRGKNLWSATKGGEAIRILRADDDRQEAEFVANEILQFKHENSGKWEDFAVLFRMNAQSRILEESFRELKIPYRIIGGKSFFDRREVKDLLGYASVLLNPDDDVSLLRVLGSPPRGIGATTTELALDQSSEENSSLYRALTSAKFLERCATKTAAAIRRFREELEICRGQLEMGPTRQAQTFTDFFMATGYLEDLRKSCKTEAEADGREENVRDLLKTFAEYEKRHTEGLRGFADSMSLDRDREEKDDSGTGVTLITFHAAKGLEFPEVYLVGAEDGILPHERSKVEGTMDEERRLLYVGLTRAMRRLTILHCTHRTRYGSAVACTISPFLKEIEGDGVEHGSTQEILNRPASDESVALGFDRMRAVING